jgi:hypothetical protein
MVWLTKKQNPNAAKKRQVRESWLASDKLALGALIQALPYSLVGLTH